LDGAHRLAAVLEDLHPAPPSAQLGGLLGPDIDHPPDRADVHASERQVVSR
jgi:hypothetical protein